MFALWSVLLMCAANPPKPLGRTRAVKTGGVTLWSDSGDGQEWPQQKQWQCRCQERGLTGVDVLRARNSARRGMNASGVRPRSAQPVVARRDLQPFYTPEHNEYPPPPQSSWFWGFDRFMNMSDTSSDYYTRTLSPSPLPLDHPLDGEDSDYTLLLPLDRYIQAYRRAHLTMECHATKKALQEDAPGSDRGSSSPMPPPKGSKPPALPADPPSRMPGARKTAAQQNEPSTRVTRQRATTEGPEVPVLDLPPTCRAPSKPPVKEKAPLLNLPGPSPPIHPVNLKNKKDVLLPKPTPPTQLPKPAVLLFGRTLPAPHMPPASKDPVASRALFKDTVAPCAADLDIEYEQDGDEGDNINDNETVPMQISPMQEHVKRRSSVAKKGMPVFTEDAVAPCSNRFTQPPQVDDEDGEDDEEEDVFGAEENVVVVKQAMRDMSLSYYYSLGLVLQPPTAFGHDAMPLRHDGALRMMYDRLKRAVPARTKNAYEEVASPAHKKVATAFDHIVPGYEGDKHLSMVPDCVREIVDGGFKVYLPLHLFDLDVLRQEEDVWVGLRPGESVTTHLPPPKIPESKVSCQLWMQWMKRMLACLEVLGVPAFVIKIFSSHFDHIMLADDFVTTWQVWLLYDMRRHQLFKGEWLHDIARLDRDLLARMRDTITTRLQTRMEQVLSRMRLSARASSSKMSATSLTQELRASGTKDLLKLKYLWCLICGSRTHVFDKDALHKDCKPCWLIAEPSNKGTFVCP
ncbi:hypothetical protein EXIGLDRAFT_707039 [Exidia glandulosa HHB12029]|uniref:Uncharacterized protein n=1 Tax=Exidia glandulosa HHB12029 TaxID=1314781 RepID=A0A165AWE6_EXIGL|nr:hypothetical protein EXIGLDRAFT_707039 [Exidia glandulosa HHB12029]